MSLIDSCVEAAIRRQADQASGQVSMFDLFAAEDPATVSSNGFSQDAEPPNGDEWDRKMKLAFEKEMLGIYVSDHPLREIADDIRAASTGSTADVADMRDGTMAWIAGMIAGVERRQTRSGKLMARVTFEDLDGSVEAVFFPQAYERFRDMLVVDEVVRIRAKIEKSDRGVQVLVQEVEPLVGRVIIRVEESEFDDKHIDGLNETLSHYPGKDVLEVHLEQLGKTKMFRLPTGVNKDATGLHAELIELFGTEAVREL